MSQFLVEIRSGYRLYTIEGSINLSDIGRIWTASDYDSHKNELYDLRQLYMSSVSQTNILRFLSSLNDSLFSEQNHTRISILTETKDAGEFMRTSLNEAGLRDENIKYFTEAEDAIKWVGN